MREEIANLCHKQWSGWMEYLFSKCYPETGQFDKETGNLVIPEWAVKRWTRQMNTEYENLSEDEKESDREEADRVLALLARETTEQADSEEKMDLAPGCKPGVETVPGFHPGTREIIPTPRRDKDVKVDRGDNVR